MKIIGLIVLFLVVLLIVAFVIIKSQKKSSDNGENQAAGGLVAKSEDSPAAELAYNEQNGSSKEKSSTAEAATTCDRSSDCEAQDSAPVERKKVDTGGLVHILVAEDNLSNYKLVEVMLRNIAVTENAINGKVAVQRVREVEYDMVFMDVKMPVMNGLEATREIRKFDTKIPIIAVTANVLDFDKNMALASGCNEFVPKPITRKRLCEVVETYGKKQ